MRIIRKKGALPITHQRTAKLLSVLLPWSPEERLAVLSLTLYVLWDERFVAWEKEGMRGG